MTKDEFDAYAESIRVELSTKDWSIRRVSDGSIVVALICQPRGVQSKTGDDPQKQKAPNSSDR